MENFAFILVIVLVILGVIFGIRKILAAIILPRWQRLAKQGNANAQYNLGGLYAQGQGVLQDDSQAIKWFSLSAEQGHTKAQYNLALFYANGWGMPQDYREAAKWYELAANQGNKKAQIALNAIQALGYNTPHDDSTRLDGFNKGRMAYNKHDYETALREWQPLAERGNAEAQSSLGTIYYNGEGVKQDYNQALKWYSLAAHQGHPEAQYILAGMYTLGQGIQKNFIIAYMWLNLAILNGIELATSTRNHIATTMSPVQITEAEKLTQEWLFNYKQEHAKVQATMNEAQAYNDSHDVSNHSDEFNKGKVAYDKGDYKTALREWQPLAQRGNAEAQLYLGRIYYNGMGVSQDYQQAIKWFSLASEQGHTVAQIALAFAYYDGNGVAKNIVLTQMWFNVAASNGGKEIASLRDKFATEMTPEQIAEAEKLTQEWLANHNQG